jgi:hypothetical protein
LRKTEPPPAPDIGDDLGDIVDGAFDEVATFFEDLVEDREKAA